MKVNSEKMESQSIRSRLGDRFAGLRLDDSIRHFLYNWSFKVFGISHLSNVFREEVNGIERDILGSKTY